MIYTIQVVLLVQPWMISLRQEDIIANLMLILRLPIQNSFDKAACVHQLKQDNNAERLLPPLFYVAQQAWKLVECLD